MFNCMCYFIVSEQYVFVSRAREKKIRQRFRVEYIFLAANLIERFR